MAYRTSLHSHSARPPVAALRASTQPLIDFYDQYFEVIYAQNAAQVMECFRLRHQVYCLENPFEDPLQNPHGIETDQFDTAAIHSLLRHRATGEIVGTVRLILPRPADKGMGLPIGQVCKHELVSRDTPLMPWASTAEISRFAVSKKMRRRAEDGTVLGRFETSAHDPRRRIPDVSLGLMRAVLTMASKNHVTHVCAVMEPMLLRMLRRLGMMFPSLGPEVDYHGRRQPCYSDLDTGLARVWIRRPDIWELLTSRGELWPLNHKLVAELGKSEMAASCDQNDGPS